jgi:hypothetical protein
MVRADSVVMVEVGERKCFVSSETGSRFYRRMNLRVTSPSVDHDDVITSLDHSDEGRVTLPTTSLLVCPLSAITT